MSSKALRALVTSLLGAVVLAVPVSAVSPVTSDAEGAAEPSASATASSIRKIALGVSMLEDTDIATFNAYTASVGRAPAAWSVWSDWGGENKHFPSTFLSQLPAKTVPVILWQPVDPRNLESQAYTYERIVDGHWDGYIRQWALAAKALDRPVIVRFAHEMDGKWFPWGTTTSNFYGNRPGQFIKAWAHIWKIFRGQSGVGATNVRFMWSPLTPKANVYPTHKFVDYVGFTSFNWGGDKPWRTMVKPITTKVAKARRITPKPIIVAETGTTGIGGNKADWIKKGHRQVYNDLPQIAAIIYFNIDMAIEGQPDWSMETSPGALATYRDLLTEPRFKGKLKWPLP